VAGHNKWKQIKRKKAITDAKRGKNFTKIIREITVASKEGGGSPDFNPRLRLAVDTAKAANMPQDNIDRAIKRGTGELEGVNYEEINYEGYGPGGAALFIECLTDNQNRTVADLRNVLERKGGNLGTAGSVAWQFDRKGQIYANGSRYTEDALLDAALTAGADDVKREGDDFVITTEVVDFHQVQQALRGLGVDFEDAELAMIPKNEVDVSGDEAERLLKLIDALEENDDVQKVYCNGNIDEKVLAEAAADL
jgi:YebC/PmpR family DNA-binding regulatory protein